MSALRCRSDETARARGPGHRGVREEELRRATVHDGAEQIAPFEILAALGGEIIAALRLRQVFSASVMYALSVGSSAKRHASSKTKSFN